MSISDEAAAVAAAHLTAAWATRIGKDEKPTKSVEQSINDIYARFLETVRANGRSHLSPEES